MPASNRRDLRQQVLTNYDWSRTQHNAKSAYAKVTPEVLFHLLNDTVGPARTACTHLIYLLASRRWYIHYGVHEGGSDPGAPPHILVMAPRGIHVNVQSRPDWTLYVTGVTYE